VNITGTVLLNARGVNINGYDCFVNLAKDEYAYKEMIRDPAVGTTKVVDNITTPIPGKPEFLGITSNPSDIKFGNCCFLAKNWGQIFNFFPESKYTPLSDTYTLSLWSKVNSYYTSLPSGHSEWTVLGPGMAFNCRKGQIQIKGFKNNISYASYPDGAVLSFTKDTANWHHYLLETINNRVLFFYDGNKIIDANITPISWIPNYIGLAGWGHDIFIDDLVFINNQALYTSNFTKPTTYLLDSDNTMNPDDIRFRRNIIAANVDKKLIIPDPDGLKQY